VLETDCPYLTPVPHRGKRNEPAYIELVAAEIARIRGISIDDVARQTTENALALFGIG
jgi:TatD DNase family protein